MSSSQGEHPISLKRASSRLANNPVDPLEQELSAASSDFAALKVVPDHTPTKPERRKPRSVKTNRDQWLYLPFSTKERLYVFKDEHDLTVTEVFVAAFNDAYPKLEGWFPSHIDSSALMPVYRSTRRRRTSTGYLPVKVTLKPDQWQVLQDTVKKYNTNYSVLASKVLEEYLPR